MRAIIIDDKDAKALLDKLKLESLYSDLGGYGLSAQEAWHTIPESTRKDIVSKLHSKFHYHVCKWLQDQGASVT